MMAIGALLVFIFVLLFFGITGYVLISFVKRIVKKDDSVLHILRERLAKGEITEEEFMQKKALLQNKK